jgi:hypothetical protein
MNIKGIIAIIVIASLLTLTGCSDNEFREIPPGYIGKILTPTGWQEGIKEAGMVDIKEKRPNEPYSQLVLCEATSVTIKETFGLPAEGDPEDHRIVTKTGAPISVDVRIQVMVPEEKRLRESIFAQVTPTPEEGLDRTSRIRLSDVYEQFAKAPIRNRIRGIFMKRKNYQDIIENYDTINAEIRSMIAKTFQETKIPLQLVAGEVSNVKADQRVLEAENINAAADAQVAQINKVGEAMRNNPAYLEKYKWDVLREAAGKGVTIIVNDGDGKPGYTVPLKTGQ